MRTIGRVVDFEGIRTVAAPLRAEDLRPLAPECRVVQFAEALSAEDYRRLAELLQARPDVTLRAYGGASITDLDFLQHFPELRRFSVDGLWSSLTDISGLGYLPESLERLRIGETKKRLSLAPLERFTSLRRLSLEGQTKDLEVVSSLPSITSLTLRSITLPNLSLLLPLRELRALDLKLGGTKDLTLLPEVGRLQYVELWLVRGLADLSPIADVPTLEMLFLQALRQVTNLPDMRRLRRLTGVHIETLKGLRDLRPLADAPALEKVVLYDMPQLHVEDVAVLQERSTLCAVTLGLGSLKRNAAAEALLGLPRAELPRHPALLV